MRLRYICLPDYGQLKNVAVVFGQNQHIENRKGVVNFVVGLNGSGKSSLLRAVYDIFHSLSNEELPKFPVTLAYDIAISGRNRTVVFHRLRGSAQDSFLVPLAESLAFTHAEDWQDHVENVLSTNLNVDYVKGDELQGNGILRNYLPSRVLAYTSGDLDPWKALVYPSFPVDELAGNSEEFAREQERPYGWTAQQEKYDVRVPMTGDPGLETQALPTGVRENTTIIDERCILLHPEDIRLSAVALGIWQAALEREIRQTEEERNAFRQRLLNQLNEGEQVDGARRILNELDWLWATHAAFIFTSNAEDLVHPDIGRCFWLYALADRVLQLPLDEILSVITLGNRPPLVPEDLIGGQNVGDLMLIGEPMRNAHCGAEALRALFGKSLWGIFTTLRSWRTIGLLKEVQLTVKRIRQTSDAEGNLDDCILSYANFSDGEQMLLGRMALLLLLDGQENSLLLLDEPETHFNDAWKRQIIDMVDDGILKTTAAQVLVATHTSLALTDVFSVEITRLVKENGITVVKPITHPTFGADPGRILLHVFGAPDIIGARAAEFLRGKLTQVNWSEEDRNKLSTLIDEIGSGWPRAKLIDILESFDAP
jgi:energy-coupling factor transporter ATP-binding protein EcfA2